MAVVTVHGEGKNTGSPENASILSAGGVAAALDRMNLSI
jgi:hypothetical protein